MITNWLSLAYWGRVNANLIELHNRGFRRLRDRWLDEAAELALAGNPQRAGYVEYMVGRL